MADSRFDEQDSAHSMFGVQRPEQAKASQRRAEIAVWAMMAAVVVAAIVVIVRMG